MRLVISLATRGRPTQLLDTIRRSVANWTHPDTEMWVMCDADDQGSIDAATFYSSQTDHRVFVSVRPREDTIAAKWNRATEIPADLYLVAADDDPYITPGYDTRLLEAAARFPDGIGMVYGHMANASFSGVVAPTAGLVKAMGNKIFPEYFPYWFCDHWTDNLARLIDRISFADVRTDQSHVGKTQELREPGWWATWFDAAYLMLRKQAFDILDMDDLKFFAGKKDKERIKSCAPLIEYRSRWINDSVRANAPNLEAWSKLSTDDARYQRVKDKAIAMIPHLLDDYGMDPSEAARFRQALMPSTAQGLPTAYPAKFESAIKRWVA